MDVDPLLKLPCPIGGGGEVPQLIFVKNTAIPLKMYTFSRSHREKKIVRLLFYYNECPLQNHPWHVGEVMCSILPHDIMKHHDFCWKIRISDLRSGCNKFYSSPGSNSLDGCWPLSEAPLVHEGEVGKFLNLFSWKYLRYLWKCTLFRVQTERKNCSSALLLQWLPPSKAPLAIGRSCVQFFLMT